MAGEIDGYLERIEDLLGQIENLIKDLPAEALNWRPIENSDKHEMNSLAVLATHVAGAARFWAAEVIGGETAVRNRLAEFEVEEDETAALIYRLQEARTKVREVVTQLDPTALSETRHVRDRTFTVRWSILHIIDHTALHLGHMQITYQLWNHGQSINSPRWFERIKD